MNLLLRKIENLNWKIFIVGMLIGVFAMSLNMVGVDIKNIINPFFEKTNPLVDRKRVDVFELIFPKLKKQENQYTLKPLSSNIVPSAYAQTFEIPASSYIVIDYDSGQILEEKESSKKLPIASLTKIMTSVIALDLATPDELFTISSKAARMPATKIGVVTGENMTVKELLNAVLLTSANDAAEVIKEGIDAKYQSEIFIRAMNEKARLLGLHDTSFTNAQGFDNENNYSTTRDFAILSHYALSNYPLISETVKKDYEFLPADNNHKQFDLYNWNGLLDVYPNVHGIKIGNTGNARYTTAVISEREDKKVLVVLLGAPGVLERDLWTSQLLDIGFEKLGNFEKVNVTEDMLLEKYSTWKYWN